MNIQSFLSFASVRQKETAPYTVCWCRPKRLKRCVPSNVTLKEMFSPTSK